MTVLEVAPGVYRHTSTAHSYVLKDGHCAVLVNVGDGSVLDDLPALGVTQVLAAVLTHAAWEVASGVPQMNRRRIPVYAPETDRPLLTHPKTYLNAWSGDNNYDGRPLNLLPGQTGETLPLRDYRPLTLGAFTLTPRPAPGPTAGHTALLCDWQGQRLAFTGALLSAPRQVPRLASTMWTYNGGEGIAGSILSLLDLHDQKPDLLLPAFGEPMTPDALPQTVGALNELLKLRRHNPRLLMLRVQPYEEIRPWLLFNRTSLSNSYALRSESGKAVVIDFGYDFAFGFPPGTSRDARRPWLYTTPALLAQHGISRIKAVIPTHAHDDHVAGIPLLREVYGAELWAAEPMADLLAHPEHHRFPCRWFETMTPDQILKLEIPFWWEEFTITPHALPGHARHAVALLVEAHGERVLFTGDQYAAGDGLGLNYTYQNEFLSEDYVLSAALVERLKPDLLLSGHWSPVVPDDIWLERARERGQALQRLHQALQPHASQLLLTVVPLAVQSGEEVTVTVHNSTGQAFQGTLSLGHKKQEIVVPEHQNQEFILKVAASSGCQPITLQGQAGEPPLLAWVTVQEVPDV